MKSKLSVVIPVHNPRELVLQRALNALRTQSLDLSSWELVIVDNASTSNVSEFVDLSWHPNARILREDKLGLTFARIHGFTNTSGEIVVLVDDDNVLDSNYLEEVLAIAARYPCLGTWSGNIRPEFDDPAFSLKPEFLSLLTLRDVTKDHWSNDPSHDLSTPWGAGMCLRRGVIDAYLNEVSVNSSRTALDLRGSRRLYGGDTDIAYIGCYAGFGKGVFARLNLLHLIPRERCSTGFLREVAYGRGYSEVLHEHVHSGNLPGPDRWSVRKVVRLFRILRKAKLDRSLALAQLRGRRRAIQDLTQGVYPA